MANAYQVYSYHAHDILCPKCKVSLHSHKAGTCLDQWVYTGVLLGKIRTKKAPKVSTSQKEIGRFVEVFDKVSIDKSGAYLEFMVDINLEHAMLYARYEDETIPLSLCKAALLIAYTKPSDIIADDDNDGLDYDYNEYADYDSEEEESSEYDDE